MDGFKDSTKMKYMDGGMVGDAKMPMKKAMGGAVMGKPMMGDPMMGGYAKGGKAKAGMKMPMKKGSGGDVKMPSPAESAASGNRMSAQEGAEMREMMKRDMKKRVPATRREPMLPPVGESVKSGNRMSAQEGAEMRGMTRRKMGGLAVMPKGKC